MDPKCLQLGRLQGSPSLVPEAWETTQGSTGRLKDRELITQQLWRSFLSIFYHLSPQCQLIFIHVLQLGFGEQGPHLDMLLNIEIIFASFYHRFMDQTPLTSSWTQDFLVCLCFVGEIRVLCMGPPFGVFLCPSIGL